MKQNVSAPVFIVVIVVALIIVGVFLARSFSGPSAAPAAAGSVNGRTAHDPGTPTADQMKQIQEWKKSHPGAFTRY